MIRLQIHSALKNLLFFHEINRLKMIRLLQRFYRICLKVYYPLRETENRYSNSIFIAAF